MRLFILAIFTLFTFSSVFGQPGAAYNPYIDIPNIKIKKYQNDENAAPNTGGQTFNFYEEPACESISLYIENYEAEQVILHSIQISRIVLKVQNSSSFEEYIDVFQMFSGYSSNSFNEITLNPGEGVSFNSPYNPLGYVPASCDPIMAEVTYIIRYSAEGMENTLYENTIPYDLRACPSLLKVNDFNTYPNPIIGNQFHFSYKLTESSQIEVQLFNQDGELLSVPVERGEQSAGTYDYRIDDANLERDKFYFIKLIESDNTHTKMIHKQ